MNLVNLFYRCRRCLGHLLRFGLAALIFAAGVLHTAAVRAQVCAAPGVTGALTVAAANTLVNTYYAGTAAGGVTGGNTVGYASASPRGAAPAIAAGDLVLIIQMQDGTAGNNANTAAYAFPATAAGIYEFARVVSVGVNVLNLSANLSNTYTQNTAASNNQTYQVIRVPQYSTLTINAASSVVPSPWDGTSGGIVAVDVAGAFTNNGSIDVSYAGFRGNAGITLAGVAGAVAQTTAAFDRVQADTYAAHGGKGEGTAGTPNRALVVFSSPGVLLTSGTSSANGSVTNATTTNRGISATVAYLTVTGRSYSGGSRGAGAPGNAGGGGDDALPVNNSENSGGGGGANKGAGGIGGNSYNTNQVVGGRGGNATTPAITNKLTMGGSGGSGTSNNNYALDTSGGAGGGLIFVKAGTVGGTGLLVANGQAGRSIPVTGAQCPAGSVNSCDAGGGGGAGGGIVVLASSGTIANAQAVGGQGGEINGIQHGPGGGGGGGFLVTSLGLGITANTLTGGAAGLTNRGGATVAYGAGAGAAGAATTIVNTGLPANAGGLPANCLPALTTTKVTSTPAATAPVSPPGTTTYSIVVSNAAGRGDVRGATLYDPSLPGGTATVANPPVPAVSFSAVPVVCGLGTRTATIDPANGAITALRAGTFSLPGGCTLTYTFTVSVPITVPNGTYSNSALVFFLDPTDTSGSRTVTTALPPAAAGLTANTSFTTGGAVGGSNYDGNNVANTGDDIRVQRQADLQVSKTNGLTSVVAGSTVSYTLTFSNLGPADASGAVIKDPVAAGVSCTTLTCATVSGSAVCPLPASVTVANLQGAGITLSTFPGNSSITFVLGCGVTATGL